jgi:hypothetical protein
MKKWIATAVLGALLALPALAWAKGWLATDDGCDCPVCCHHSGK